MGDLKKQTRPLAQVWERHRDYSGKASDHVRTSALAGLAVAWLFTGASEGDLSKLATAHRGLLAAAACFATSLGADILHYFVGGGVFRRLAREYEREGKVDSDEVEVPLRTSWVPRIFYIVKVWLLFGGYVVLAVVFVRAIFS